MMDDVILIIDHTPDNRRFMNDVLQAHRYHTLQAANLREAQSLLKKKQVTLIVCDLNLPDAKTLDWIKTHCQQDNLPPIIAVSARIPPHTKTLAQELGCLDFLAKPLRIKSFIHLIEDALGTPSLF